MLAAGMAWKLLDFFWGGGGGHFITLKGFCQEINGDFFVFWHFSVTYNVSFTNVKLTAILFYQFVLNILYYRLYDLQIWKCVYMLEI